MISSSSIVPSKSSDNSNTYIFINAYKKILMHRTKMDRELLFSLSSNNIKYANALFLSIYEVNLIEKSFLRIWNRNRKVEWIDINSIQSSQYNIFSEIVSCFFIENEVYFEEYFRFICIFLFFDYESVFSLMIVMAGIYSNIYISDEQLKSFICHYSIFNDFYDELSLLTTTENKSPNNPEACYSLKKLRKHIKYSDSFRQYIESFRDELNKIVFSKNRYNTITNKIQFYYYGQVFEKRECCLTKLYKCICTREEKQYHFDYYSENPSIEDFQCLVNEEKLRFGYGSRNTSTMHILSIFK